MKKHADYMALLPVHGGRYLRCAALRTVHSGDRHVAGHRIGTPAPVAAQGAAEAWGEGKSGAPSPAQLSPTRLPIFSIPENHVRIP